MRFLVDAACLAIAVAEIAASYANELLERARVRLMPRGGRLSGWLARWVLLPWYRGRAERETALVRRVEGMAAAEMAEQIANGSDDAQA